MTRPGQPKRRREQALAELLMRERDQLQHQLELVHAELASIERRLESSKRRIPPAAEPKPELDELLAELEEQIESDERARRRIVERLEVQSTGEAMARRRLDLLLDQREVVLNMFVAGAQLHEARDLGRVRASVLEIVVNLIGCEQVGLFEHCGGGRYRLTTTLGLDPSRSRDLVADESFIGRRLLSGEPFISPEQPLELGDARARGLSVCLPLEADGQVVAVLLLFELLDHKTGLSELDLELLELLRNHAGSALTRAERDRASDTGTTTWTQA